MSETEAKRSTVIDILRVIGLILVISAHCGFSSWFTNIRDFDVVLLMFVSGISFSLTYRENGSYLEYVKKRFRRLIVPVWVFLTAFFLFSFLINKPFTWREIIESYLLLAGGVLFVWVYRVFFTSALLNPFLIKLCKKTDTAILTISAVIVFLLNDLLSKYAFVPMGSIGKFLQYLITYTIAYGLISFIGMVFHKADRTGRIIITVIFIVVFGVTGVFLKYPAFYDCKYPPILYYCSYGLTWSGILYILFEHCSLHGTLEMIVTWCSAHTMDIFMWHIMAFYLMEWFNPSLLNRPWLDLLILLGGGIIGAFLQSRIQSLWRKR